MMFHVKPYNVAVSSTSKTMVVAFLVRNRERGCLFLMEWTEALEFGPNFFQFNACTHYVG